MNQTILSYKSCLQSGFKSEKITGNRKPGGKLSELGCQNLGGGVRAGKWAATVNIGLDFKTNCRR